MNILITGGAGFIGYHLARYHVELGDFVCLMDNFSKSAGKSDDGFDTFLRHPNVHMFEIDLTQPILDLNLPPTMDIVYHLAAINGTRLFYEMPYQVARTNLLMTLNLLDWLQGRAVSKLVYSSTSEVYAGNEQVGLLKIPTDEGVPVVFPQPTHVRFSYGTSKFMGEFLCLQFGQVFNRPVTVVRYHNIYGPRMGDRHVIPEFIARLKARENPFRIYGGSETRAFCYIVDAVRATYLVAAQSSCDNEIVHVGNSSEEITIERLARLMIKLLGEQFEIQEGGHRSGSVSRRCPDTTKLRKLTGFEAKIKLEQGLSDTLKWYLTYA